MRIASVSAALLIVGCAKATALEDRPIAARKEDIPACTGADGKWRCKAAKPLVMGIEVSPVTPPSWNVANWYVDPANTTGCASDANSCTSATCAGVGVGPCVTASQITQQRWGIPHPVLAQTTTIMFLSGESLNQEAIVLEPIMVQGANFALMGTLAAGASFTAGAVTAKARTSSGGPLKVAGFPAGATAGMVVYDSTRNSYAIVDAIASSTATLTQPFTAASLNTINAYPTFAEDDGWTAGDSLHLETLPLVNLKVLAPQGGDANAGFTAPVLWVQNIYVPDPTGSPIPGAGRIQSTFAPTATGINMGFSTVWIDPFFEANGNARAWKFAVNSWINGGCSVYGTNIIGGAINTSLAQYGRFTDVSVLDGDVLMHGTAVFKGAYGIVGWAYIDSLMYPSHGGAIVLEHDWFSGAALYGPGTLDVQSPASAVENATGGTWTAALQVATLKLSGLTTGTSYSAGAFTDGRSVTAANLDTFGGLQDVATGSRYAGTN